MSAATSILIRTAGKRHGPITRVFSPGDLGELLKPFVFLDYLEAPGGGGCAHVLQSDSLANQYFAAKHIAPVVNRSDTRRGGTSGNQFFS